MLFSNDSNTSITIKKVKSSTREVENLSIFKIETSLSVMFYEIYRVFDWNIFGSNVFYNINIRCAKRQLFILYQIHFSHYCHNSKIRIWSYSFCENECTNKLDKKYIKKIRLLWILTYMYMIETCLLKTIQTKWNKYFIKNTKKRERKIEENVITKEQSI